VAQVISYIKNTSSTLAKKREASVPINKSLKEHLDRIDKASGGTVKTARSYYETNQKINIIIVAVGIVLLANSIVYTWHKQTADAWSLFSGGLGISSFATLFFTKPQENITKALGNLAQVQMIYKSYCLQFDTILDYHIKNEQISIDELNKINNALQTATYNAIKLVQSEVESETHKASIEEVTGSNRRTLKMEESTTNNDDKGDRKNSETLKLSS
jgi:hypothetical protein